MAWNLFRATKPAPVPPEPSPLPVVEPVSVVLRRQVPVRWGEPARSWIGGLPRMPEAIAWPLGPVVDHPERAPTPLHFVAQIACADLPPELWGGLGPREGWLLLFLNAHNWDGAVDSKLVRVLHIPELGPERAPPPGLLPVHDETYTGPGYGFVRGQDEIPSVWRRWPVDLVTIPNRVIEGAPGPTIIPENFASILYDGAAVNDSRVEPPGTSPFSWRGALYVVDSIARVLAKDHTLRLDDVRAKVSAPNWIADARARTDAELAKWLASPAIRKVEEAPSAAERARLEPIRARVLARIESLRAARQLLADSSDETALLARIEHSHRDYAAWREGAKRRVAALREQILSHALDTAMAEPEWDGLRSALAEDRQPYWVLRPNDAGDLPELIDQSLLDFARDGVHAAQAQLAADYYVSDERRDLVPVDLAAFMEPHWRALYANRPHRMGGLHDGIQSEPREGPTRKVLLFQIATDDAMHWCWGDAGAYYVFIGTDRLALWDFSQVGASFENH